MIENKYDGWLEPEMAIVRKLATRKGFKGQDLLDLEQDVAVDILKLDTSYLTPQRRKALVIKVAHDTIANALRDKKQREKVETESLSVKHYDIPAPYSQEDIDREIDKKDCLEKLPKVKRATYQLYEQGYTYREIGRILKIGKSSVMKYLREVAEIFMKVGVFD